MCSMCSMCSIPTPPFLSSFPFLIYFFSLIFFLSYYNIVSIKYTFTFTIMNDANITRVTLHLDSKFKTSGVNENYTITLATPIERVRQVDIISVELPFTFYVTTTANNTITFDNGTTTYNAVIVPGNYNGNTFPVQVQTQMNNVFPGFTVTYDTDTYHMTFANPTAFNIHAASTAATLIGVTTNSGLVTSFTAQDISNLSGAAYVLVHSTYLTRPMVYRPYLGSTQNNILYKVSLPNGPGEMIVDKNLYVNKITYPTRQIISTIDLQLTDPDLNQLDLNGLSWSISLVFYLS